MSVSSVASLVFEGGLVLTKEGAGVRGSAQMRKTLFNEIAFELPSYATDGRIYTGAPLNRLANYSNFVKSILSVSKIGSAVDKFYHFSPFFLAD